MSERHSDRFRQLHRLHRRLSHKVAAVTVCVALGLSACGDSGSDASGTSSGADGAGIATARAAIADLSKKPFTVEPLSKKPPADKTVAFVNCTVSGCNPGKLEPVTRLLGWTSKEYSYDFAKGPQDFVAALDSALASKPDYLVVTQGFPETVVAKQIAQAKAAGIPYIDSGGASPIDGVTVNVIGGKAFEAVGTTLAHQLLAMAGGSVEIAAVLDPTQPAMAASHQGFTAEMSKLSPNSKVNVLKASLSSPPTTTVTQTINFLRTHPDVKYLVYPAGTALYTGMASALKSNGLNSKVKVVLGALSNPANLPDIRNGDVAAGIAFFNSYQYLIMDPLARLSVGDGIGPKAPPLPWVGVVTVENATEAALDPPDVSETFARAWHVG